jgi:hypothetical protein
VNSVFYQTTPDHAGASPPADRGRVATTITLAAVATCMVLGKSLAVTHPPVVQRDEAPVVRIVDPDFCKNQTWPYIDARCLKRVAPDQPVAENHAASAPANPGTTPAPVPASLANIVANGTASATYSISATPDKTAGPLPGTPPTTGMNGAGQNQPQDAAVAPTASTAATDNPANAPIADSHRNRRSQHWQHSAFFGFRF